MNLMNIITIIYLIKFISEDFDKANSGRPKLSNHFMFSVHFYAGVRTYTFYIAKCHSYDGGHFIPSGLISPNVSFTFATFLRNSLLCIQPRFI